MKRALLPAIFILATFAFTGLVLCRADADESSWGYYCQDSPALNTWKDAWPESFDGAIRNSQIHHEIDEHGEGIVWKMAHWLVVHNPPHQRDRVELSANFEFRATAHLAVVREFWTYRPDDKGKLRKAEWVRRTVAHITAGGSREEDPAIRASATRDPRSKSGFKRSLFDSEAWSNNAGAHPIAWKGKTLGWIAVSWTARDAWLRTNTWWLKAGEDDHLAQLTTKIQPKPDYGGHNLSWNFAVRKSAEGIEQDLGSPSERPDYKLPPMDVTR